MVYHDYLGFLCFPRGCKPRISLISLISYCMETMRSAIVAIATIAITTIVEIEHSLFQRSRSLRCYDRWAHGFHTIVLIAEFFSSYIAIAAIVAIIWTHALSGNQPLSPQHFPREWYSVTKWYYDLSGNWFPLFGLGKIPQIPQIFPRLRRNLIANFPKSWYYL